MEETLIQCSGIEDPSCVARFWSYVGESDENGCRQWRGTHNSKKSDHGRFPGGPKTGTGKMRRRKAVVVSRFAWALAHGDAGDFWVLHSCDVDDCVEVTHLRLGTAQDNVNDTHARYTNARGGEGHGSAKLTKQEVLEVYDLSWRSPLQGREIACLYVLSEAHVSGIKHGRFCSRTTGHVRLDGRSGQA